MALETRPFDAAEFLTDDESIAYFLQDALEEGDPVEIARSVRTVIRARGGIEQVSAASGIQASGLEKLLLDIQDGNLGSFFVVLKALHLKFNLNAEQPIAA